MIPKLRLLPALLWLGFSFCRPALALNSESYAEGIAPDGSLRVYAPAVLRPDEGTIEVTVRFSKPTSEFGNEWEFLFQSDCAKSVGTGGNTFLGLYSPPAPETGLSLVLRSRTGTGYLGYPSFTCTTGQLMNLAFSWGNKQLRLYVNGVLKTSSTWNTGPIDLDLLPPFLSFSRLGSFNASQLRISTRQRAASELGANPALPFTSDADTSFIADQDLARYERRVTTWHTSASFNHLMPLLRTGAQCFNEGDAVSLRFLGVNFGASALTRTVTCTAKDADGLEVMRKAVALTVPGGGQPALLELPLAELSGAGHYPLTIDIGGQSSTTPFSLALAVIGKDDASLSEGAFGSYYGQHHQSNYDTSVWERMHVHTSRAWAGPDAFMWYRIEPVQGQFDFRGSDAYVKQCQDAGIEVLGLLGYPSRWATITSSAAVQASSSLAVRPCKWAIKDINAWKAYVYATALRYKDTVKHWEIYNEVNFHPPSAAASYAGSTADYLALLQAAYAEIKRASPNAKVVLSGFSPFADTAMPTDLLTAGAVSSFDIFATHAYSGSFAGIDSTWINAYRAKRPNGAFWQTEQYWNSMDDPKLRAFKTVEIYVDFLIHGCERFFNMGDSSLFFDPNSKSPEVDYSAIAGVQQQVRLCDSYEGAYSFTGSADFTLRHYFKRSDGQYLSILGASNTGHSLTVTGSVTAAYDTFQRPLALVSSGGKTTINQDSVVYVLSPQPLVIESVAPLGSEALTLSNKGFESIAGDSIGGLSKATAVNWTLRTTSYDPAGTIVLTSSARTGGVAPRLHSSGAGKVYLFQDIALRETGTYWVSAYFRLEASTTAVTPYMFVYDRNAGLTTNSNLPASTLVLGQWVQCTFSVKIPNLGSQMVGVGFGISSGAGDITIDDVNFWKEGSDPDAPYIKAASTGRTLQTGQATSLSVVVSGLAPFTYQWKKDGVAIPGATADVYRVASTSAVDAGSYTVVVANSVGSVTSSAATFAVVSGFSQWQATHFSTAELADGTKTGPAAIYSDDGLANLTKYALGLAPTTSAQAGLPSLSISAGNYAYAYTRPSSITDVTYAVETSTDLVSWTTTGVTQEKVSTSGGVETWRGLFPFSTQARQFFRLKLTLVP